MNTSDGAIELAAYEAQWNATNAEISAGRQLVGFKVGATSTSSQKRFGTDHPTYGPVFADTVLQLALPISRGKYLVPKLEPEIAFSFGRGVSGKLLTPNDILAVATEMLPAIEVADSRLGRWDINFIDSILDNGSAAAAILCHDATRFTPDYVRRPSCRVLRNGVEVTKEDRDGPKLKVNQAAQSVSWLVDALAITEHVIEPGMFVLSGSLTDAIDFQSGDDITCEFDSGVSINVTVGA